MGDGKPRSRSAGPRGIDSEGPLVDEAVGPAGGRIWTSVIGSVLVAGALAVSGEPRHRREQWTEWHSLWSSNPRVAPDSAHLELFTAWLVFAYPLLVVMTVVFWFVDASSSIDPPRWVFFGMLGFAVLSGAFHFTRSMLNLPRVTRAAQLLAGWPQEAVLLGFCLWLALATIGH